MSAAYTPGPWAVHCRLDEKEGTLVFHAPQDSDHRHVCDCSFGSSIGAEENAANARLIAAAPEMLAALHNACSAYPDWEFVTSAIAKAEGRK